MKCPCCGAAELIHDTRDLPYVYKGESTTIPAVTGDFCPACGEAVLNREHGDRYSESIGDVSAAGDAAYVIAISMPNRSLAHGEPALSAIKKVALLDLIGI